MAPSRTSQRVVKTLDSDPVACQISQWFFNVLQGNRIHAWRINANTSRPPLHFFPLALRCFASKANVIKLVYWDRTGLCLFSERLEQAVLITRGSIRTIGVESRTYVSAKAVDRGMKPAVIEPGQLAALLRHSAKNLNLRIGCHK
jgi:hypothetical protein